MAMDAARSIYSVRRGHSSYKVTGWAWPKEIPAHWKKLRLKDIAGSNLEVLPENTPAHREIRYIDIGSVTAGGVIANREVLSFGAAPGRARRIVRRGDVVVSTVRTYLRAIAQVDADDENLVVSTGFSAMRARRGVLPRFLFYLLRSHEFVERTVAYSDGISYPSISPSKLNALPVWLPEMQEQAEICTFLDSETMRIRKLIEKKEKLAALLREKQAKSIESIVRWGCGTGMETTARGVDWIGKLPASWCAVRNRFLFSEKDERGFAALPILEVSIHSGVTVREFSDDRIEQRADDLSVYKRALPGDIVFNKMRMWQGAVGVAPVAGLVSPDYTVARPANSVIGEYFAAQFRLVEYRAEIMRHSHGIHDDRNRLYWDGFASIYSLLPPAKEQQLIVRRISEIRADADRLVNSIVRGIELLEEYRLALISAVVTGQVTPATLR